MAEFKLDPSEHVQKLLLLRVERLRELARALELLASGHGPTLEELAAAPLLSHWRVVAGPPSHALTGSVTGHPILGDSREILTSELTFLDETHRIARTVSRWYRLDEPAPLEERRGGPRH